MKINFCNVFFSKKKNDHKLQTNFFSIENQSNRCSIGGMYIKKKKAEYQKSNHEHFLNEKRLSNHTQTQDLYIFIKINDKHVLSKENLLQMTKKKSKSRLTRVQSQPSIEPRSIRPNMINDG